MMRTQLQDAVDRGEVVAMLVAAEWPIYGRYGYGMAVEAAGTVLDASVAEFRSSASDGTVELVDAETLLTHAPAVFDGNRITSPGAITRSERKWRDLTDIEPSPFAKSPANRMRALHRDAAGNVDGYVVYDPTEKWSHNRPRVELRVIELMATTPIAWLGLWRYLAASRLGQRGAGRRASRR